MKSIEPNQTFKQKFVSKILLYCGEALIDMNPLQHKTAFKKLARDAVFNTTIGIGRKSIDVGLISGVSKDLFGEFLVNTLKDSAVDTSYLYRSDQPSTLAF